LSAARSRRYLAAICVAAALTGLVACSGSSKSAARISTSESVPAARAETGSSTGTGGTVSNKPIDFVNDYDANIVASALEGTLQTALIQKPAFAGAQVIQSGIEIDLAAAKPSSDVKSVVDRNRTIFDGAPIPIKYRAVHNSLLQLQALTKRVSADRSYWTAQGVTLRAFGPDLTTNTVLVAVAHYQPAVKAQFAKRYGSAITVQATG
jgi:hypothetical protein